LLANTFSSQQVAALGREQIALVSLVTERGNSDVLNINNEAVLEATHIKNMGKGNDDMYLAGANADMKVDAERYKAEAKAITDVGKISVQYVQKQADSEATNRKNIAEIEGRRDGSG
jgi:hypothetical protein